MGGRAGAAAARLALGCMLVGLASGYMVDIPNLGKVRGVVEGDAVVFRGIPYAEAMGPSNRFQMALPVMPWNGTLDAVKWHPACPQHCHSEPHTCPSQFSENCLIVNVFVPKAMLDQYQSDAMATTPVWVFIHGGNYRQETCSEPLYEGNSIATFTKTVVVTMEYRIGALGFFMHKDLETVEPNLGIHDQMLALEWVQKYISAFSGDRSKVTLEGQSAGAGSTLIHYTGLAAKRNLFSAVVSESNPAAIEYKDVKQAQKYGDKFVKKIGCGGRKGNAILDCLRSMSVADVLDAQHITTHTKGKLPWPHTFRYAYPWSPTIGTPSVKDQPLTLAVQGNFNASIPYMLGWNKDDALQFVWGFFPKPVDKFEWATIVKFVWGLGKGSKILKEYPAPPNEVKEKDVRFDLNHIVTDYAFACPQRLIAHTIAKAGGMAYLYNYSHALSFNDWGNYSECAGHVCHGVEIPILFNSTYATAGVAITPAEQLLGKRMMSALAHLSVNGQSGNMPAYQSSHAWKAVDASVEYGPAYLLDANSTFGDPSRHIQDVCPFWDKIGYLTA